jgi:hypothetical protein
MAVIRFTASSDGRPFAFGEVERYSAERVFSPCPSSRLMALGADFGGEKNFLIAVALGVDDFGDHLGIQFEYSSA